MADARGEGAVAADGEAGSSSRLLPLRRDALSEAGRREYDALAASVQEGRTLAGIDGPAGIWLRIPEVGAHMMAVNEVVRHGLGFDARLTEIAILATAREIDSDFIWTLHEPVAQQCGVADDLLERIRNRAPLPPDCEREAAIVALAREAVGEHQVSPDTYAAALRLLGESGVLRLAALIGNYVLTGIMLAVAGQRLPADRPSLLRRRRIS